jgi:antitoxin HicB
VVFTITGGNWKMKFNVIIHDDQDDGSYIVSCPALAGCHSKGEMIEEAVSKIKEAFDLESLQKDTVPIPAEPHIELVKVAV